MKKIAIISAGILITANLVFAADFETEFMNRFEPFKNITTGTYTCPYRAENRYSKSVSGNCVIEISKNGFSSSNCPSEQETAELINSGKCTYDKGSTKYYSCQYPEGSCSVELGQGDNYAVSCSGSVPEPQTILENAKAGKCYSEKE